MAKKANPIVLRTYASSIERRLFGTSDGLSVGSAAGPWHLSGMYSLFMLDLSTNEIYPWPGLDPASRTNLAMYQFPVQPSSYEISEPAATTITPTQNSGKFIESHGGIFKDIRIGGTVGFRPNVPSTELVGGLKKSTGVSISPPGVFNDWMYNDERGIHNKEATGLDDMIFLRNLFRAYWDSKQNSETARRVVLVWTYAKENESWIVEPVNFTTTRDSSSPLSWKYSISLRTILPLTYTFYALEDPIDIFSAVNKSMQMLNRIATSVAMGLNRIASLIDFVITLPFDIVEGILSSAATLASGIASFKNSLNFDKLKEDRVRVLKQRLQEAFGMLNSEHTETEGAGQEGSLGLVKKEIKNMLNSVEVLLCLDPLWKESRQVQVSDYSAPYRDEFGNSPISAGSPLNVENITIPDSARQETVVAGEDIRGAAKRLLGNDAKWKLLVILNDLKAPYIGATSSTGILAPGDPILVPKNPDPMDKESGVQRALYTDASSEALSPMLKQYGRDLRISSNVSGGVSLTNLQVNNRGDLEIIEGTENVYQAFMIKFATERGELATHPTFGAKYPIGTKFPKVVKLQEYSINIQQTVRQDPRTDDIKDLRINVDADQIYVNLKVALRGADVELPINFAVRR